MSNSHAGRTPSSPASLPSSTSSPAPRSVGAARYRTWQMWRALTPRPLTTEDHEIVEMALPPGGRTLFATMARNDQRHSLSVYRALREHGCVDADLLAAALLHDSGKGAGRVRLWVRPVVVLLRACAPRLLRWLARAPSPVWRRPFYSAWHHAEIGADLAAAAGLSERVVLLIRTHHQPNGPAAELHAIDDAS